MLRSLPCWRNTERMSCSTAPVALTAVTTRRFRPGASLSGTFSGTTFCGLASPSRVTSTPLSATITCVMSCPVTTPARGTASSLTCARSCGIEMAIFGAAVAWLPGAAAEGTGDGTAGPRAGGGDTGGGDGGDGDAGGGDGGLGDGGGGDGSAGGPAGLASTVGATLATSNAICEKDTSSGLMAAPLFMPPAAPSWKPLSFTNSSRAGAYQSWICPRRDAFGCVTSTRISNACSTPARRERSPYLATTHEKMHGVCPSIPLDWPLFPTCSGQSNASGGKNVCV